VGQRLVAPHHPAVEFEASSREADTAAPAEGLLPRTGAPAARMQVAQPRRQRAAPHVDRVEGQARGQRMRFAGEAVERGFRARLVADPLELAGDADQLATYPGGAAGPLLVDATECLFDSQRRRLACPRDTRNRL